MNVEMNYEDISRERAQLMALMEENGIIFPEDMKQGLPFDAKVIDVDDNNSSPHEVG